MCKKHFKICQAQKVIAPLQTSKQLLQIVVVLFRFEKRRKLLSEEDAAVKAEIIACLNAVNYNHSFASANLNGDMYRTMFPDSNIAKHSSQKETKMKYVIQFGIATMKNNCRMNIIKNRSHLNSMRRRISKSKNNMMDMCNFGVINLNLLRKPIVVLSWLIIVLLRNS